MEPRFRLERPGVTGLAGMAGMRVVQCECLLVCGDALGWSTRGIQLILAVLINPGHSHSDQVPLTHVQNRIDGKDGATT